MPPVTSTEYWEYAHKKIAAGIITREDAQMIARVGSRKCGNWVRHLRDLESFVKWKGEQSYQATSKGVAHFNEEEHDAAQGQDATSEISDGDRRQGSP